jgi:protein kinase C substrate 80K-H
MVYFKVSRSNTSFGDSIKLSFEMSIFRVTLKVFMVQILILLLPFLTTQSVRGIDPFDLKKYENFKCFDGSNPQAVLNDDYCDCLDGSDEPGTSACRKTLFYCQNTGHKPVKIPSIKVNDGICDVDCCDGSDEWLKGSCPNICKELAEREANTEREYEALRQRGAVQKLKLIRQAKEIQQDKRSQLIEMRKNIAEYSAQKHHEASKQYHLESRVVQLDTDNSYLKMIQQKLQNIWNIGGMPQESETQFHEEQRVAELAMAREELETQTRKVADLQQKFDKTNQEIQDLEKTLNEINGPMDCFLPLRDQCYEKSILTYKYKVCMFKSVEQDHTNLGKFESFDMKAGKMLFKNGQSCWQGPDRTATVVLECGISTEIIFVSEPAKCEYLVKMTTPAMCELNEGDEKRAFESELLESPESTSTIITHNEL